MINLENPRSGPLRCGQVQVRVESSFVAGPLVRPLEFWWRTAGVAAETIIAPYAQVIQNLLAAADSSIDSGELHIVLVRWEDWVRHSAARQSAFRCSTVLKRRVAEYVAVLETVVHASPVAVVTFVCPPSDDFAVFDGGRIGGQLWQAIAQACAAIPRTAAVPVAASATGYGLADIGDPQADKMGHIPYRHSFFPTLAGMIVRALAAPSNRRPHMIMSLELATQSMRPDQLLNAVGSGCLTVLCDQQNADVTAPVLRLLEGRRALHFHRSAGRGAAAAAVARLAASGSVEAGSAVFVTTEARERDEVRRLCPGLLAAVATPASPGFISHLWSSELPGLRRGPDAPVEPALRIMPGRLDVIHEGLRTAEQISAAYSAWRRATSPRPVRRPP